MRFAFTPYKSAIQKPCRPRIRQRGGFRQVPDAVLPRESVIGARIDVHLGARHARQAFDDALLRVLGHEAVLAGDMQHQWVSNAPGLVEGAIDADAVIANGRVDIRPGRHQVGELAAEAEADRTDHTVAPPMAAQPSERPGKVFHGERFVEGGVQRHRLFPAGRRVGIVVEMRLDPPQQVGRHRQIATRGIVSTGGLEVRVNAADLQDDDQRRHRIRTGGLLDPGIEPVNRRPAHARTCAITSRPNQSTLSRYWLRVSQGSATVAQVMPASS